MVRNITRRAFRIAALWGTCIALLSGCAADANGETEDDLVTPALVSGRGPAPVKTQRAACEAQDFRKVNIGPFGTCREILLDRDQPTAGGIESWSAYDVRIALPPGWAMRDVKEIVITNQETGLSRRLRPVLYAPLTVYLHKQLVFGLQVREGLNRLTYSFSRKSAPPDEAPLVYVAPTTFRKRPSPR
ncbi:MAG: hypothetical protein U0174_15865 [Polyangiaceae bacterium]